MLAVRAIVFDYEAVGTFHGETRGSGLDSWLGNSSRVEVELNVLRVRRVGLLVQELPGRSVGVVWEPILLIEELGGLLCRFHEGPRGEPWRHRYCTNPAVTHDGYCRVHRGSWKALYERCAQGFDPACLEAYRLKPDEEFSVYVLDYGGSRVKVGLTQSWRFLWRIAEQPHVAAARVYTGRLLDAREREKKLGRMKLATEGAGARLETRLRLATGLLSRLRERWEKAAERLAGMLAGLGLEGSFKAYAVMPRSTSWLLPVQRIQDPVWLLGRQLQLADYWAGLLALRDNTGVAALHRRLLHHRLLRGTIKSGPA